MKTQKKIILFDGVCTLCNKVVQWIIQRDTKDVFRYAALQSDAGKQHMAERGITPAAIDSILLIEPGVAYFTQSDAALRVAQELGGLWRVLALFRWIPKPIRDAVYNFIAKNRYKWFGKEDACMRPTPDVQAKFLK